MTPEKRSVGALVIGVAICVTSTNRAPRAQTEVGLSGASHVFGVIPPGERSATQSLVVDNANELTIEIVSPVKLAAEVTLPDNSRLSSIGLGGSFAALSVANTSGFFPTPGLRPGYHLTTGIHSPLPGEYIVRVSLDTPLPERTPFVVSVYSDSTLRLAVSFPEAEATTGRPIVISAVAVDGAAPIAGAAVAASFKESLNVGNVASIRPTITVQLLDDGVAPDALPDDGVYTGIVQSGLPAARYIALVHAEGVTSGGTFFKRDASAAVRVTERNSRIRRVSSASGVDENANGLFDRLRVSVDIETGSAGNFNVSAVLRASNGRTVGSNKIGVLAEGAQTVFVDFPAAYVLTLAADGPYTVADLRLDEVTTDERLLRDRLVDSGTIAGFRLAQFDGFVPQVGDVNQDGAVNCADVSTMRASFGKRTGQAGFDSRADLNNDGVVNVIDLTMVTRLLPAGTRCP